jgi:Txe/YoeB family toxin of Txe-Axe toxin-antitoxin module
MPWGVVYYRAADGRVPADEFLDRCPDKVEATILAVLEAVRRAPPPAFSGGGKWEAMHGSMGGYYEIRVTGPGRRQYRPVWRTAPRWNSPSGVLPSRRSS